MEKKVITKAMQNAFVKEYLQTQIFIFMRNKVKFIYFHKRESWYRGGKEDQHQRTQMDNQLKRSNSIIQVSHPSMISRGWQSSPEQINIRK